MKYLVYVCYTMQYNTHVYAMPIKAIKPTISVLQQNILHKTTLNAQYIHIGVQLLYQYFSVLFHSAEVITSN